jgi:hypothetical protein
MNMRFVICALAVATAAVAEEDGARRGCSNATLRGQYGFTISGSRPSGPPPAPLEAMIGIAITTFDGRGNLTQVDNIHGGISGLNPDRPGTGTYTIKEDCTGTMTLINQGAPPLELRIVVVDKGREVRTAVMSPATVMVTSNGRKL